MYKATEERIKELKAEHGEIYLLTVEDKAAIFKTPSRKAMSYSLSFASKDPLKSNETLLRDAFVEGDKELIDNDAYFLGAQSQVGQLLKAKESKLEKL